MFEYVIGSFLIERKVITEEEFNSTISEIINDNSLLGSIAVRENMLTESQVEEIHRLQMKIDKRFGAIAVERRHLSPEQLNSLINKQHDIYMDFFRKLDEKGLLPAEKLDDELNEFKTKYRLTEQQMQELLNDDVEAVFAFYVKTGDYYMNEYMSLALKYVVRFICKSFFIGEIEKVDSYFAERIALQKVTTSRGRYFLAFGAEKITLQRFNDSLEGFVRRDPDDRYAYLHAFLSVITCIFNCTVSREITINSVSAPLNYKYSTLSVNESCYRIPLKVRDMEIDLLVASGEKPNFVTISHNV